MDLWLQVFQECSADPVEDPYIFCPAEKIEAATSVAEIAEAIHWQGVANVPTLAGPDMEAAADLKTVAKKSSDAIKTMQHQTGLWQKGDAWIPSICVPYTLSICTCRPEDRCEEVKRCHQDN